MAHYELHAWCLLVLAWVFVPFYARSMVFTMPEFLERRFSHGSRYVLSIVSLITFIVSKIAVGIFAGGVVFAHAAARRCSIEPGRASTIDSFWIGSVLVIVLTGLYTTLGGMRAVAYNDAVQVDRPDRRLGPADHLRPASRWAAGASCGTICGSDMFNLWKPLIPPGVRGHLGAGAGDERRRRRSSSRPGISTAISPGWACCSARRSSACGTGAPISTSCSGRLGAPNETDRPAAAASSPPF